MSSALLEFENVTVLRGDRAVLDQFSLTINDGEHAAIIGPNGSGKSTLIKLITRECYPLDRPGARLRLFGQESWNLFELRALIGVVSYDLIETCTRDVNAHDMVLSGHFGSIGLYKHQTVTDAMRERTQEILDLLEINHLAKRTVDEMSSGEARRVVLGRALVHRPKALILDEPANSLDLRACYELRQTLRKLAQSGIAIILVTHHLPDLIPEIERVVLLREGKIFGDGPKEQLLTETRLRALFDIPLQLTCRDGSYQIW